jgi:DNA-binding MarR family transcriptional regulator
MATKDESPTIGAQVWRLSMRWRAAVDKAVAPFGLTHAKYSALASLYGHSFRFPDAPPSQRELAEIAGLDSVYVSKLVSNLERDGFVTRSPHPDDTRAVQLSLTTDGIAAIEPAVAAVRELHRTLLAPLGGPRSARSAELRATLQLLLDNPLL